MKLPLHSQARQTSQQGMASIIVISVLVVVLTLISLGFARLMDRAVNGSVNGQIGSAADYAARSGISDAVAYLTANPTASATKCSDLLKTGGAFAQIANLSGDDITKYTCVLINPTPNDLFYQQIDPSKSQVIKMTTDTTAASVMLSWQSSDRSKTALPPNPQQLLDESSWNYEPILRVTLFPIPPDGSAANLQANSKTFFFYPTSGNSVSTIPFSTADGSLNSVSCFTKNVPNTFSGTADMDCNVIISGLSAGSPGYYYLRITPLQGQADVRIKATNISSQAAKFQSVQAILDVTAKSGGAVKRLQARVNTGGAVNISPKDNNIPEYALRSAGTICKRLNVNAGSVSVDPTSQAYCSLTIASPPPSPPISAVQNIPVFTYTPPGGTVVQFWAKVNPNGVATNFVYQYHTCNAVTPHYGSNDTNGCTINSWANWTTTPAFSSPISAGSGVTSLDFYKTVALSHNTCYRYRALATSDGGTTYYSASNTSGPATLVPDVNTYTNTTGSQGFCTN